MHDHAEEEIEEEQVELAVHAPPRIFEGEWKTQLPPGFDAVLISLDGRVQSDLDWKKAREQAQKAVEKGYALMWDIQLGLFDGLAQPLTHQTQFLTLTLSLEHFRDSLWKEFKAHTIGLCIFRGSADFSQSFFWDSHQEQNLKAWLQEIQAHDRACLDLVHQRQDVDGQHLLRLFCRDVAIEYLALLATRIPDSLPTYLYLDATSLKECPGSEIQLLNPERYDRLQLALKGHQLPFDVLGWGAPTAWGYSGNVSVELPVSPLVTLGVCIPPLTFHDSHAYQQLEEGLQALNKRSIPFKLIAENNLTSQWEGLDYLLYHPAGLSLQGKRKLQGFCAAGGTVISIENLVGFPFEITLSDWLRVN